MGTGAKIAIGCGCIVLLGTAAFIGIVGAGAWWAKGKLEEVGTGIDAMTAQSEEIERFQKQANANPYTPTPDGVIAEERFLKFMEVRRQVHAVYEGHEAELRELQKKAESTSDKLTLSELWSAGGTLARLAGALRLAQMKALADTRMSEAEYRDIQLAVYNSAWASAAGSEPAHPPAEAFPESARRLPGAVRGPRANVELFRKHEAEIRKYAMHGLAFLGL